MTRNSTRDRRECVERHAYERGGKTFMECHICHGEIDLVISTWEAEHPVPFALGGRDVWPVHWRCHKVKTATDVTEIAKGKRARERNLGIKRSARPMMGSRASGWKKKMSGEAMRTIWKAVLKVADKQTIQIPANAVFRHVHEQNDAICVWYECDSDNPITEATLYMIGTGHDMSTANISRYIGSVHIFNGKLVYHIFEGNERWERSAP